MKVVILAGGLGTRMSEITKIIPKPMVKILNKPILIHIMEHYYKYGFKEFYIALGYKGKVIKNFFKGKKFNQSFKVNNYIHNSKTNIIASSIIADKLEKLNSREISIKNTFLNNNLNHLYAKNYLRLLRQKINYKVYNSKFPPFSRSEITSVYRILKDFNTDFKKIKIELVGPKLIRLNKIR